MNEQTIRRLMKHTDLVAAVAVVVVVTMLIIPLPSMLLDLFITINISAALAVVVASMYLNKALDFAAFPSLLLLTTMFRLAINVSVTRLILTKGDAGSVAEDHVLRFHPQRRVGHMARRKAHGDEQIGGLRGLG